MESIADQWARKQREALDSVLEWAGTPSALAKILGLNTQNVHGWIKRGRISATAAAKIDAITKGKFKKTDIRPDVAEWWM